MSVMQPTPPSISDPNRDTRQKVKELTLAGIRPRQIAAHLGISTQRVYQHLDRLRRDGELEEASA